METGTRVRLKGDPAVIGLITDAPPVERANRIFLEIELPAGRRSYPLNQLERVDTPPDAINDLRCNKFSAPADLRRALTHLRMTGRLADMIYSMGATNTEFHAYQFKPVLKLLNAPSRGLLIADEVGLGKTIEAGLVWTELVARFDCRRLLVICPKPLVQKWRDELRNKFNVDARFVGAGELLDLMADDAQRREGFAAVASLSALRPPRGWNDPDDPEEGARAELARRLSDSSDGETFDLVVFDEAHHLRNTQTMNHRLGELVTAASDYSLFLSATPINLRANDLRALLKLLDPDTFDKEWLFDLLQQENAPLVAACEAARDTRVPMHKVAQLVNELSPGTVLKTGERLKRLRAELDAGVEDTPGTRIKIAARLEEMSLLGTVVNRTRRRDVAEIKVRRRPVTVSWEMTDAERRFYDRASNRIAQYASEHDINERFLLAQSQRLVASSLPAAYRHWGERSGALSYDDEEPHDRKLPGPLVQALGDVCDDPGELAELERHDTKYNGLLRTIRDIQHAGPSEKIIVFTSFRRTIDYLGDRLRREGIKVIELHAAIKEDRSATVTQFADAPAGTILLTSEVGGEGLDLQFCRTLINWDLPWNPMRVEQRIGRIDRIGQSSPTIDVFNLIAAKTIEEMVYERLYIRLGIIKQTLGDFEPILGEVVRDIELLLTNPELTPKQREEELERAMQAAEQRKRVAEELEREAPGLIAHGDAILQKVQEAHEPHRMLTAGELRDYVAGTLISQFHGTRFEPIANVSLDVFDVRLSPRAQVEFARFRERYARRYPTRFSRDAATGVRVVFGKNPDAVKYRGIESLAMSHPLARFAAHVREEREGGARARPVTSFRVEARSQWKIPAGKYVIAVEKWSVEGVLPIDRLAVTAASLSDGAVLHDDVGERLLMEGLSLGPSLLRPDDGVIATASSIIEEKLAPHIRHLRNNFEESEAARHYDLAETQRALLLQNRIRRETEAQQRITQYRLDGTDKKMRLARMEEGKLNKFIARIDLKLDEIRQLERRFNVEAPVIVGIAIVDVEVPTS